MTTMDALLAFFGGVLAGLLCFGAVGLMLIVDIARNTDHQGVDITPLGK